MNRKSLGKLTPAKPDQQALGPMQVLEYRGSYMDGNNGTSQTPRYKAAGNHSARPTRVVGVGSGPKRSQQIRG